LPGPNRIEAKINRRPECGVPISGRREQMSSIAYRSADGARPARSRDRVIIASYSVIAIGTLLVLYVIYGSAGEYTAHFELATVSP